MSYKVGKFGGEKAEGGRGGKDRNGGFYEESDETGLRYGLNFVLPPPIPALKSYPLLPYDVSLFGDRAFKEVIKLP